MSDGKPTGNATAVVCCHDVVPGPPHFLRDYLISTGWKNVLFISHVNRAVPDNPIPASSATLYRQGQVVEKKTGSTRKMSELFQYGFDVLRTLWWSLTVTKGRIDLFAGVGNLNAVCGVLLKRIGKVRQVAYYVIDYIPDRYPGRLKNWIYNYMEKLAAKHSDVTWNYSPVMIERREKRWGKIFKNQMVTPHGATPRYREKVFPVKADQLGIAYFGFVNREQGCELVIECLPALRKAVPGIQYRLVGHCTAEYREYLEGKARKLGVADLLTFYGMVPDHKEAEDILLSCAVAVAPYRDDHPFVRNTDPGKVKTYLACGLPVIMTDVGMIAKLITKASAGVVIPHDKQACEEALLKVLGDMEQLRRMSENAGRLAENYSWPAIYGAAFAALETGKEQER